VWKGKDVADVAPMAGAGDLQGVDLRQLPPSTTLLVRTTNSLYRVVITGGPEVYLQGGAFFPVSTSVHLEGASYGGSGLRAGWIGVDLSLEIRSGGRRIITSRVRAIATEPPPDPVER
jgi:hypothetical protein